MSNDLMRAFGFDNGTGRACPDKGEVKVYERQSGRYIVYRTGDGVAVSYSDDLPTERLQRQRLSALAARRALLDGALSSWRSTNPRWNRLNRAAREYDARIAAAVVDALEGSTHSAAAILQDVSTDLAGEMAARARLSYLLWTLVSALVMIGATLLCYVFVDSGDSVSSARGSGIAAILRSICAGILGAVYSIALGISNRELKSDMRRYDYFTDSFVRIGIGMLSAFILCCFLMSGAVQLQFGGIVPPTSSVGGDGIVLPSWPVGLLTGFVAGFAERMVPDLLNSYAVKQREPIAPVTPPVATHGPSNVISTDDVTATGDGNNVQAAEDEPVISGQATVAAPSGEEEVDGCDIDMASVITADARQVEGVRAPEAVS